jgi:glycosyltransferase involved in cell wall biosynthesis
MSTGGRLVAQLEHEGSTHFTWPIGKKSLSTLRLIWKLRQFLLAEKVDILHVRSRMPAWLCYLAWKGMDPSIRPHLVTTVHGLYSVGIYSSIMTRGERIIAVSETARAYILDNYPNTPVSRVALIPRGIDPAEFPLHYQPSADWLKQWQTQYPQLRNKRLLLLPGRLTRLKGHEAFIELIERLKQYGLPAHGLIVGGEDPKRQAYAQELRRKISNAGLSDMVTFTGHRSDLKDIMAVSDIVFSLSSKPESFGRTTLEALSIGIPVIGYDHGGVGEILSRLFQAGKTPLNDSNALVTRARQFLEQPQKIQPINAYSLQDMLDRTLQTYLEVMGT